MPSIVYLVSGANRGIGLELVKTLLARPNVVVFAGTRDPSKARDLQALEKEYPGKLHVVKLTSANEAENKAVAEQIKAIAGRLDVVIANAGIAKDHELGLTVPLASLREHFEVNTLGPLALFQATYPLLKVSTASPKFVPISSLAGSLEIGTKFPLQKLAYGTSKAALNYLTRKLRMENDGLVAFPICPGPVDTDMGREVSSEDPGASKFEPSDFIPATEVAPMLLKQIDESTRETDVFVRHNGETWPW